MSNVTLAPDGNGLLASASFDGTLKLWNLMGDGNLVKTLKPDGKPIYDCAWSPDSKSLVTVGMSKTVTNKFRQKY